MKEITKKEFTGIFKEEFENFLRYKKALFNMLSAIQANAPLYKSTPDNPDSDNTNPN